VISTILLCAGKSERMGRTKALLDWHGRSLVAHALDTLNRTKVDEIVVVTGPEHLAVEQEARTMERQIPIRIACNPNSTLGLMTSLQAGIGRLDPKATAFLVTLVDLPFLEAKDFNLLIDRFRSGSANLIRFVHQGEPCHPALISTHFRDVILDQPARDHGCSFLFQSHAHVAIEMGSERGRMDLDRPEQYHAHVTP
jgi:molybdenum cofactor cytidylyltransferase